MRVRGSRTRTMSDSPTNKSQSEDEIFDDTATSLPERITDDNFDNELVTKLRDQVEKLTLRLCSAEEEIEILSLENSNLKQSNQELEKKNVFYKTLISTPTRKTRPSTPKKIDLLTSKTIQNEQVISDSEKKNKGTQTISTDVIGSPKQESTVSPSILYKQTYSQEMEGKVSKICIISENKYNKIRTIAENKFDDYELCHYLTPYSGIKNMFRGLESKLRKYTMSDFCIILIGETDFESTKDYSNIILHMRTVLKNIQHTNVILCMPTYSQCIDNVTLYNKRVEMFNKLLYQDILTHEHAYFIDCNKNLTWDHRMYKQNSGTVNNYGMKVIFQDIAALVTFIRENTLESTESGNINNMNEQQPELQYFRLSVPKHYASEHCRLSK
ncbi:unnamed protein product [Spodoptera littoralis]|uniref:Uncharacterized protein n=1 Tax=Spodoptera littoralis TaxID=7109 RepID=A0A9P0IEI8_SPOLI|nr:unnamed protein product [Spodoptera littoralis]CAH1645403.1 unnamed protein product [Spodoptera littoralis]